MAEPTATPQHHDFASSSTTSCSASTSHVPHDIFINLCGQDPDVCSFATALCNQLISRRLQVFLHKLEYMIEEEFASEIEAVISQASVQIAIFSPNYAGWKWCLDALVHMRKSGATILPIFYKVKPGEVRWANHGPYAKWMRSHEEKARYDSETIKAWKEALFHVSEISGFEQDACNEDEEQLLSEVVKSVFNDCPRLRYHVFLNHRGPDSKMTLAKPLYDRLTSNGLRVFLDNRELDAGMKIDFQIEMAIQFASVHIAIFSPNYAKSRWCLDELYLMAKSEAIILPVFYQVKPSDFYEDYAKDLVHHEKSGRYKSERIQRWRNALSEVAEIKCLFDMDRNEEDVLHEIVQEVLKHVTERSQVVHSSEVDSVVKCVLKENVPRSSVVLVESDPEKDGYFGLAEKLIDFENAVRLQHEERVEAKVVGVVGAAGIGKTALAKLFFTRNRKYYKDYAFLSYAEGSGFTISPDHSHIIEQPLEHEDPIQWIKFFKHLFSDCHALLILDDAAHLDSFLSIKPVLRPKSLILVTSRDKNLLKRSGIVDSSIYHLDGLSREHSQKLLCFSAFGQPLPQPGFADLLDGFLTACDGLPFSLKGLGRLLCGKNESFWLEQSNELGNRKLHQISYYAFAQKEEQIYDSLNQEEQQIFLDIACFFIGKDRDMTARICGLMIFTILEWKCLVEVDTENKIKMHPNLMDFGRKIANGLMPRRLWHQNTKNINDLLKQSSSRLSQFRGITMIPRKFVELGMIRPGSSREVFRVLKKLRGSREVLPGPKNLKFVVAQGGYVKDILSRVGSPDLIWLHWYKCPCSYLPSWIPMENLRVLEVAGSKLTELWRPESQAPLQLRELKIFAPLYMFPESIGQMKHLEKIVLKCSGMTSLPDSFGELTNLQYIDLEGASSLQMLPSSFAKLSLLKHLCLKDCRKIKELPVVEHLTSLEKLDVSGCQKLQSLAGLRQLRTLIVEECCEIQELHGVELTSLTIQGSGHLTKLGILSVKECCEIRELSGVEHLTSLEKLVVRECDKLQSIPGLGHLTNLQTLHLEECGEIQELPDVELLVSLQALNVSGCQKLHSIPGLGQLTKLRTLRLVQCREIQELSSVEYLASLEKLDVRRCQKLQSIPGLGQLTKLRTLRIEKCREIQELPSVELLASLETLEVRGCQKLQSIPSLGQFTMLRTLSEKRNELQELVGVVELSASSEGLGLVIIPGLGQLKKTPENYMCKNVAKYKSCLV